MSIALIRELKDRTQASLILCKRALGENDNNIEKSIEWLRKKNIIRSSKSDVRTAEVRGVFTHKFTDTHRVFLVVCVESDFVLRNEKLHNTLNKVLQEAKDMNTLKDFEEKVVEDIKELSGLFGENIVIKAFYNIHLNNNHGIYIHKLDGMIKKVGLVSVDLKSDKNDELTTKLASVLDDIAVHITALDPKYLHITDVEQSFLDKEKEIFLYSHSSKPAQVQEKIWLGKQLKIFEENVLVKQKMIQDETLSVEDSILKFEKQFDCKISLQSHQLIK